MDAPAPIRDFYNRIKNIDMDSLVQRPDYIEPRKDWFESRASKFKLRHSVARSNQMANKYGAIQLACYDFIGKCAWCSEPRRHVHGTQNCNVYEIEQFPGTCKNDEIAILKRQVLTAKPGLYLYPGLLENHLVLKNLLDRLFHQELLSSTNATNLHGAYQIAYPKHASDAEQRLSFFDPASPQLRMQPRLGDSLVRSPLAVTDFVEQLRWFKLRLPENIKSLVESIIPLQVDCGTAFVSTRTETLGPRQGQGNKGHFLDVSLGCDGIMVIGKEQRPDEQRVLRMPTSSPTTFEDSWCKWIIGLDEEDENDPSKDDEIHSQAAEVPTGDDEELEAEDIENDGFHLAAIRLKHGDALLFSGESVGLWHGIARVVEGTTPACEQNWPCRSETQHSSPAQECPGCMKGHRVDFVLH